MWPQEAANALCKAATPHDVSCYGGTALASWRQFRGSYSNGETRLLVLLCAVVSRVCGEMSEVEETLKRIQAQKGVIGTIVVNSEGIPIRTTLDNSTTVQYAGLLHQLSMKAKSTVRDIDPQNDLTFLRIRSKKHEIMVAPDKDYLLIVIQNPSD
ncbi:dynein light chain roadblock-type 2 [Hyperolius riggenbachi]|uniref:dynein light chain roadblock-type 2 n=1 Tax=Hyperolius riggenbachi TaxID=752182 RepID=UPI0035A290F8